MRYLDICSGISAPTAAWKPLGWQALCFAEIEPAPRAVLAHHYPDVPLRGDFTEIEGTEYGPADLLVGGTPCQSFSVAGLRGGLDDERGNLALEFLRLADRARPRWLVWENVPGVLSSNGGRDFGSILGGLVELGYGFAYRVLDAQHFGVPQRRRRVFVVGHLGDWRRAAAVLFERHSLSGHPAPRRKAGEGAAAGSNDGVVGSLCADHHPGAYSGQDAYTGRLIPQAPQEPQGEREGVLEQLLDFQVTHSLRAEGFDASEDGTGRGTPLVPVAFAHQQGGNIDLHVSENMGLTLQKSQGQAICFSAKDHGADAGELSPTLRAGGHSCSHANAGVMPAVAFDWNNSAGAPNSEDAFGTLASRRNMAAMLGSAVRRLTPRECERLQGFPDDFTLVPHRGKPMADGPRYKMLGNSMAVPVVRWLGERIEAVDAIQSDSLFTEAAA